MNNLLKPRKKIYQKKSSEREVYEQDRFYQIKVEDRTGIIEDLGGKEFIETMFQKMQDARLQSFVYDNIDARHHNVSIKISDSGGDIVAKVVISKRQFSEGLKEIFDKLITRLLYE